MELKLDSGLFLKVDCLGGHCIRVRMGDDKNWNESGLNRYNVLNESALLNENVKSTSKGNTITLANGYKITVGKSGNIAVFKGKAPVTKITEIAKYAKDGFRVRVALNKTERLYGLGDENREMLQKRGHRAEIVVKNVTSYIPIPYLMSTDGWAILMNTTCYHIVDAGATNPDETLFECAYGNADFYLFFADGMPGLLDTYTRLSGRPALLPRWAYSFTFVCDEREVRARDVLYEALEFRKQEIPCDVIGLEPAWMETYYDFSTDKKWSEKRFDIPFWLSKDSPFTFPGALHRMGFHLSLWLCCDYDLSEYEENLLNEKASDKKQAATKLDSETRSPDDLIQDKHFSGGAVHLDRMTKRNEPWFQHLKQFVDYGADAFKLDGSNQVMFHPDRHWYNDMPDYEMHNLYPVIYGKQMALGFSDYTKRRSMIYTAGGYTGIQQYAATWTGDTGGGLKPLCGLLNLAMSGHSNGTCDLAIANRDGIHSGMLLPWSQLLGWRMYSEPWFQGTEILKCFKFYADTRYHLLPYIYATAWQAHLSGMPMMRPLPLAFPEEKHVDDIYNEYMLGDSLLVVSFATRAYLPKGNWYNYWTKERIKGGRWIEVKELNDWGDGKQPVGGGLFVKEGSAIPTAPAMLYSQERPLNDLTWEIYAGKGSFSFTHYDDDGSTFAYSEGKYVATTIEGKYDGKTLKLSASIPHNGAPELVAKRVNHFELFGIPSNTKVVYSGEMLQD